MFVAISLTLLLAIGVAAMYGLWRLLHSFEERAREDEERLADLSRSQDLPTITGPLGPDGVTYLCAHRFCPVGPPRNMANPRRRAYAPITGDEVEPRQMAEQILYATLVSLLEADLLSVRIVEAEPSFMPPFPHKRWALRILRRQRLTGSPVAEALDCAFDLAEQRLAKKGGSVRDGAPLDELIEDMLKIMRQELSFWERAGVYADIRQYVEAALVDQGYLLAPEKDTWLDRLRHARPAVNDKALPEIERRADELERQLTRFRIDHGSQAAVVAESLPGGRAEEIDETLIEAVPPFDELPLHDCLKLSLYEAMMAIRQLEHREDVGG
ncbi:MAG: hypothetical protein ACUVX8_19015 [Candidatus Zipacnadales bacterium]